MKRAYVIFAAIAVCLIFVTPALAGQNGVKMMSKSGMGEYLSDGDGMTLYWFKNDSTDKSACSGGCVQNWPLFYRKTVAPSGGGMMASEFGTIKRDDGKMQTTFRGYPLYYFVNDKKAGDTMGHGVKDVWSVVDPKNFPMMKNMMKKGY